jgi:tetratricopeptide (TPR) repeat protein
MSGTAARRIVHVSLAFLALAWAGDGAAHDEPAQEIATLSARGGLAARDHLRRGDLFRLSGQWTRAAADYDSALALGAEPSDVVVCRAALTLDQGRPRETLAALDRLLAGFPRHERALSLAADACEALGRQRDAAARLDRLIAITGTPTPEHYLRRARLQLEAAPDRAGQALEGLDQGIARLGPLVTLESEAIRIEVARGRPDAALRRLERIAPVLAPHEALERRGVLLAASGRHEAARAAFAAALAEIESLAPARRGSASVAQRAARLRAALERGVPHDVTDPMESLEP